MKAEDINNNIAISINPLYKSSLSLFYRVFYIYF